MNTVEEICGTVSIYLCDSGTTRRSQCGTGFVSYRKLLYICKESFIAIEEFILECKWIIIY